jgi:hypothetical protein
MLGMCRAYINRMSYWKNLTALRRPQTQPAGDGIDVAVHRLLQQSTQRAHSSVYFVIYGFFAIQLSALFSQKRNFHLSCLSPKLSQIVRIPEITYFRVRVGLRNRTPTSSNALSHQRLFRGLRSSASLKPFFNK